MNRCSVPYPNEIISLMTDSLQKSKALDGTLSSKSMCSFVCSDCGRPFDRLMGNVCRKSDGFIKDTKCNTCKGTRCTEIPDELLAEVHPDQDLTALKGGGSKPWHWICPICGEDYYLQYYHRRGGEGHSPCSKKRGFKKSYNKWVENGMRSDCELKIESYVQSLGFETSHEPYIIDDTYEIDIYIPSLKKGIEEDGYGHEECMTWEMYGNAKDHGQVVKWPGYHDNKDKLASDQGIELMHVKYSDWKNDEEGTKEKIKSFLGL